VPDRTGDLPLVIGYEWLASGLTAPWYRHFLGSVVIPHATAFGYAIELTEVLSGALLIAAAALLLVRDQRIGRRLNLWIAASTGLAALAGLVLALNFVLANRMGFSPVAADSFDEGVSLDALLVGVQIALLGVALAALARLRVSEGAHRSRARIGKALIQQTQTFRS